MSLIILCPDFYVCAHCHSAKYAQDFYVCAHCHSAKYAHGLENTMLYIDFKQMLTQVLTLNKNGLLINIVERIQGIYHMILDF